MYLGLDIGTTATKAVLVDEHHAIVATATGGYICTSPPRKSASSDPQAWIDAVRSVVAALRAEKPAALQAVRAIGLSGRPIGSSLDHPGI